LLILAAGAMLVPASAVADDSIYWSSNDAIRVANLDGTGTASTLFGAQMLPQGVTIDAAAGRIYWANFGNAPPGEIRVANLDGTGTAATLFGGEVFAVGLAADPAAGRIYWSSTGVASTIRTGSLDGTGTASTLFTGENAPSGVAIDPAANRIYWTNIATGLIRVANLDGTGTASTLFGGENSPTSVAIDPAAGRIYWANQPAGNIRVGNLDGTGTPSTLFGAQARPRGLAIDPAAGRIYWVNQDDGTIRVGNLDGTGTPSTLFGGETVPTQFLALLRAPAPAGPPVISNTPAARTTLSCSRGEWAPDLLGSFLYRAPRDFAYQWLRNGEEIAGATSAGYTTPDPGSYSCRVTASNQAGSATQTSAELEVSRAISLEASKSRVKRRRKATLSGQVSGSPDCVANQTVELRRKRPSESSFDTFATVTTDASGRFSHTARIKQPPREFRSRVLESAGCAAAESGTVEVRKRKRR
jgi:hypothetical protein